MFTLKHFNSNLSLFVNFFLFKLVLADYCEFGICESDQYCCGENKCCKKKVDVWYYWAGVLLIIFAIAVGIGLYFKMRDKLKHKNYDLVAVCES